MYSEYYEREFNLSDCQKETLLSIYKWVAYENGFVPDAVEIEDLDDSSNLDTVLYHVNTFGKEHEDYYKIGDIFIDEDYLENIF